jgi:hypothetical protein
MSVSAQRSGVEPRVKSLVSAPSELKMPAISTAM